MRRNQFFSYWSATSPLRQTALIQFTYEPAESLANWRAIAVGWTFDGDDLNKLAAIDQSKQSAYGCTAALFIQKII